MQRSNQQKVLITGCSDGSLGAALAVAFHKAGLCVYATSRNPAKMKGLESLGIQTLTLDVQSTVSIADCMPFSDISISDAKKIFDLNVWAYLEVTQAFLPLLLKSKGLIVNQTSGASVVTLPFQSTYNASKAAMAMFSDTQRLELAPFGIKVIELKTGNVTSSNIGMGNTSYTLPKGSIYEVAKERVEKTMSGVDYKKSEIPADKWAGQVISNLLVNKPASILWLGGGQPWVLRIVSTLPHGWMDGTFKKLTGVDVVEKMVRKSESVN